MVTVEVLASLDALIWLRTGERAAALLQTTQSKVSRHSRRCLELFQLRMKKVAGEWKLLGDPSLLNMERRVHQLLRWTSGRQLRLEAQHWCAHLLQPSVPGPWVTGNANYLIYQRPLQLLLDGVIDAWLCSSPDLPEHPDLAGLPLVSMPLQLVVKPGHPLLARPSLHFDDLADYPVLPLPDGAFPRTQRLLEDWGLWSCPARDRRLRRASWHGQVPVEDLMISFETPLRLAAGVAENWLPLPLSLPLQVGEALMVRREYADQPLFGGLVEALRHRASCLARDRPEVEILACWPDVQPGWNRSATPLLQ